MDTNTKYYTCNKFNFPFVDSLRASTASQFGSVGSLRHFRPVSHALPTFLTMG